TPAYVYSKAALLEGYRAYDRAFAEVPHVVCYSVKANSNLAVLGVLGKAGAGADIVSGGELFRALRAGIPTDRIIFSGVGKTTDEMRAALEVGILLFNVESLSELRALDAVARELGVKAPVALRVNPDVNPQTHAYIATGLRTSKFGIPYDQALEAYEEAAGLKGVEVVGADMHIGSQLTKAAPFADAVARIASLVKTLRERAIEIRLVDVGGGLGIRYRAETPPTHQEYATVLPPRDRAPSRSSSTATATRSCAAGRRTRTWWRGRLPYECAVPGFVRRDGHSLPQRQGRRGEGARARRAPHGPRNRRPHPLRDHRRVAGPQPRRAPARRRARRRGGARPHPGDRGHRLQLDRGGHRPDATRRARGRRGRAGGQPLLQQAHAGGALPALPRGRRVGRDPHPRVQHPEPDGRQRRDRDAGAPRPRREERRRGERGLGLARPDEPGDRGLRARLLGALGRRQPDAAPPRHRRPRRHLGDREHRAPRDRGDG